jgi:RNA recognition motif-containing protein
VNGLNLEWKYKDVIELFNNREAIVEARIVRDKSGKSKGFGYVDFAS